MGCDYERFESEAERDKADRETRLRAELRSLPVGSLTVEELLLVLKMFLNTSVFGLSVEELAILERAVSRIKGT